MDVFEQALLRKEKLLRVIYQSVLIPSLATTRPSRPHMTNVPFRSLVGVLDQCFQVACQYLGILMSITRGCEDGIRGTNTLVFSNPNWSEALP